MHVLWSLCTHTIPFIAIIHDDTCLEKHKPLWKVKGFGRTQCIVSDVQIVRETWVLVANGTSNHLVADSLRSVPSLEEVCVSAVLRMSK